MSTYFGKNFGNNAFSEMKNQKAERLNARLILLFAVQIDFYAKKIDRKNNTNAEFTVFVLFSLGWGGEICKEGFPTFPQII